MWLLLSVVAMRPGFSEKGAFFFRLRLIDQGKPEVKQGMFLYEVIIITEI